jgi:hypothetical protein
MKPAARKAYFVRYNRVQIKVENSINKLLLAWMQEAANAPASIFESVDLDAALIAVDSAFSESKLTELFIESYQTSGSEFRAFVLEMGPKAAEKRESLIGAVLNISFFSQRFQNIVSEFAAQMAADRVGKICETLRGLLKTVITNAVSNNASKQDAAREIKKVWKEVSTSRARLIARTETTTSSGFAQMETAKEFTIKLHKVWIAARDARTRFDHRTADGKRVKFEDDFDIGGVKMSHPGDPKGGPGNCCNCRCTVAFVPQKEFGPLR